MKKTLATILRAPGLVVSLSACGPEGSEENPSVDVGDNKEARMVTIDGVQCVVSTGNRTTAISCNWEAYNNG